LHPHEIKNAYINYIIFGIAFIFESMAWWMAFNKFKLGKGQLGFIAAIRDSKDPVIFTVLLEDTAAALGLVVAFLGIYLGQTFGLPVLDGVASVIIGVLLASVSISLASECKGLLIGGSAKSPVVHGICAITNARDGIVGINELRTMHLGPEDSLVNISVDFADRLTSSNVEAGISELEQEIKTSYPEAKRVFIETQSRSGHHASLENAPEV
jgi:divalent metal cation (Fe/Co/Zn/Cd) transporter